MPVTGRGKHIPWGEEEIDALVQVSDADIESAAVMWRTRAPERSFDILDAEADEQQQI